MQPKHLSWEIEAYLNNTLPPEKYPIVKAHLKICAICANRLRNEQYLTYQIKQVHHKVLGNPSPPPRLKQQIKHKLLKNSAPKSVTINWLSSIRLLNSLGTIAIIFFIAISGIFIIQQQTQTVSHTTPSLDNNSQPFVNKNNLPSPTLLPSSTPTLIQATKPTAISLQSTKVLTSTQKATIWPQATPTSKITTTAKIHSKPTPTTLPQVTAVSPTTATPLIPQSIETTIETISPPQGTIAFAFFNPAPERYTYEIQLISLNQTGNIRRIFSYNGVSEPTLRRGTDGIQLAYRAWGIDTAARSLLSSTLDNNFNSTTVNEIGGFWEDAHPDWSPIENRLIYASQRESDRRWRLYSSKGDGSNEISLNREGHSPTFAPDGKRFAFIGCDYTGNQCGLWLTNLTPNTNTPEGQVILTGSNIIAPDWSPNSEEIVYTIYYNDNNWDLYLLNSDGTHLRRLTTHLAIDGLPTWSPDGQWLAFISNRDGNWGIWLLHINSNTLQLLFSFDGGTFTPPHQTPYGERNWQDEQLSWNW